MIFRKINRIDQLKRTLNAVYFSYGYGPIQCDNRARSDGHELIVKL
jgi:hypothetical protein